MFRAIAAVPAVLAVVALGACGSSDDSETSKASKVTPADAKVSVERAARIKLKPAPVPAQAREEGLSAQYDNTATVVKDRQAVAVFVMKDADVADEVSDRVRKTAPKSARLIAHGKVLVVYAAAGTDLAAAVACAVEAL